MTTPTAWVGFIAMVTSIPITSANAHTRTKKKKKAVTLFYDDVTQ